MTGAVRATQRIFRENAMARPFEGIRVIDATHVLAGPFAT
jgi:crotonobetainyl-CoA:carnitine CoA-transferase CaiB-like acyl-CoA transferase